MKKLLAAEGPSQSVEIRDGLTFFHARPPASHDIVARVNLLLAPAAVPSVPELAAAQHVAIGFGRYQFSGNEAVAEKISFDADKPNVGVQAKPDPASLEKHTQELSQVRSFPSPSPSLSLSLSVSLPLSLALALALCGCVGE